MTDPTTPLPPAPATPVETPAAPPAPPAPVKKLNIFGLIALVLGIIGFVLAVTPASASAWLFAIPAIVLGIIGLTRKNQSKATSIAGLSVGAVAWLVSIIVTVAFAATAVMSADNGTTVTHTSGSTSAHTTAPAKAPGIGDTVTNHAGVAFTVNSVTCGLASAPNTIYGTDTPTGQFCQVKFTVKNGGTSSVTLGSDSLTGYIGKASYDSDDESDDYGSLTTVLSPLNPGLSTDCTFYVDVPTGEKLTSVKLATSLSFGVGDVTFDVG